MSENSSHQFAIKSVKRQAHRLAKQNNISKGEALELISKNHGHSCWAEFRADLLKNGDNSRDKINFLEFNPQIHQLLQVRGFTQRNDGIVSVQFRVSYISIFHDNFSSLSEFRTFFDEKIKEIISNSKEHTLIFLLINYNENGNFPVSDTDNFFYSFCDRYSAIRGIDLYPSYTPLHIDQTISIIENKHLELDSIMEPFK